MTICKVINTNEKTFALTRQNAAAEKGSYKFQSAAKFYHVW